MMLVRLATDPRYSTKIFFYLPADVCSINNTKILTLIKILVIRAREKKMGNSWNPATPKAHSSMDRLEKLCQDSNPEQKTAYFIALHDRPRKFCSIERIFLVKITQISGETDGENLNFGKVEITFEWVSVIWGYLQNHMVDFHK